VDLIVAEIVELFGRRVRAVFGADLVGVYRTGSAVTDRERGADRMAGGRFQCR
jgi:hypothetical protein